MKESQFTKMSCIRNTEHKEIFGRATHQRHVGTHLFTCYTLNRSNGNQVRVVLFDINMNVTLLHVCSNAGNTKPRLHGMASDASSAAAAAIT